MRIARTAVVTLAAATLGAGMGACGSSKKAATTSTPVTPAATTPAATTPAATTPATPAATTPAASTSGATAPGTTLSLGETAHVTFKPLTASVNSKKTYKLDVAALKIEKGSIADFKNITLDATQKKSTPYYVTVKITSPSGVVPVKQDDPDIRFHGIDDRGQQQGSVTFLGTFARCVDKDAPTPFSAGKSYTSCQAYLLPAGASIAQVSWTGSDPYVLKPVVWK